MDFFQFFSKFLSFTLVLLLPFSCCSQKKNKVLDESVNIIEVTKGESFEIELPSHPGTGYTWKIKGEMDESCIRLVKQEYRELGDERLDIPGLDCFEFETLKKADTTIDLWYIRLWKKDNETNPNIKVETYNIIIK